MREQIGTGGSTSPEPGLSAQLFQLHASKHGMLCETQRNS